jgi:hypothetical protein
MLSPGPAPREGRQSIQPPGAGPLEATSLTINNVDVSNLSDDARLALAWFQAQYHGGRPPVFSLHEVARGIFGRTEGPAPGSTFDPANWGRVRDAIYELELEGFVRQARLPQGDFGFQLVR